MPGKAFGGHGPDTRLAWFDPREFIINAEAARTYRPLLQAINAQRIPTFAHGSPVTNVGEISVNVKGGDTSQETIRNIANGLNREIRFGRIKLNVN